jgi:uncharacterized protein YqgC (DUF456 family)
MNLVIATAALVFLRAIQQQNVIHGHYIMAAITPYGIAVAEVAMVLFVVDTGWSSIPYVGTGGAIGVVAGMFAHRRIFRRA